MAIAGSNKKVTLWNRDGVLLGTIGEIQDWIWGVAVSNENRAIFCGGNNGEL
jgi:hypothetical protein